MKSLLWTTMMCVAGLVANVALAQPMAMSVVDDQEPAVETKDDEGPVTIHGKFSSLLHYRSDSDFDPSERYYDVDGQSEGQAATFFQPKLRIDAGEGVSLLYEIELGWNAWSRNDAGRPNQFLPSNQPGLEARHRQLWGQWRNEHVAVRVGYQHYVDPSGLFLDHLGGAAQVDCEWSTGRSVIMLGQLPDSTYEGVSIRDDNFVTDSFFGGMQNTFKLSAVDLDVAGYMIADYRAVDKPLYLGTAVVGARHKGDGYRAWFHAVGQFGSWMGSGVAGADQTIGTWAVQAGAKQFSDGLRWGINVFALSGDDGHVGNDFLGAFHGSGKNLSATSILTEDERRDRYDNLDERIASSFGAFVVNHAGLLVADVSIGYDVSDLYRISYVGGAGITLSPDASFGEQFVGFESDLIQEFEVSEKAAFFINAQLFVPGGAAAVFVNDVDREATQIVYGGQAGFAARF